MQSLFSFFWAKIKTHSLEQSYCSLFCGEIFLCEGCGEWNEHTFKKKKLTKFLKNIIKYKNEIKLLVSLSVLQYLRKKNKQLLQLLLGGTDRAKTYVFVKMSHANKMRNERVKWFASFSKSHNSS